MINSTVAKTRNAIFCTVTLGAAALLAACAGTGADVPVDVGSMAYPTPLPQGVISRTATEARVPDTGNMAYPTPLPQGVISRTATQTRVPDTGNMAYPTPLPQGVISRTATETRAAEAGTPASPR